MELKTLLSSSKTFSDKDIKRKVSSVGLVRTHFASEEKCLDAM